MTALSSTQSAKLIDLLHALIDQSQAGVIVPPYAAESGYWFGGGNLVQDDQGTLWLSGRYRNVGDSRTGLAAGARGLECAIFRSDDQGRTFTKTTSWSKADLSVAGPRVVSIEGTSLYRRADGTWELYISAEKEIDYPAPWTEYQKPDTGVWVIDMLTAPDPDSFDPAQLTPVLDALDHPEYLHVKDPVVFDRPDGATALDLLLAPVHLGVQQHGAGAARGERNGLHRRDLGDDPPRPGLGCRRNARHRPPPHPARRRLCGPAARRGLFLRWGRMSARPRAERSRP